MRIERAVRLELTGQLTDAEIASAIGLTPAGYAVMKMRQEYIDLRNSIKYGLIRDLDSATGDSIGELRNRLQNAMPAALQVLVDNVQQRRDPKLAQTAAVEIIKMDGRIAPVTRVGLPTQDQGGIGQFTEDEDIASALSYALKKREEKGISTVEETETVQ